MDFEFLELGAQGYDTALQQFELSVCTWNGVRSHLSSALSIS